MQKQISELSEAIRQSEKDEYKYIVRCACYYYTDTTSYSLNELGNIEGSGKNFSEAIEQVSDYCDNKAQRLENYNRSETSGCERIN